jgi:hypothetical protein
MTEEEWSSHSQPEEWLLSARVMHLLHGKTSARKLRLFAVACCQRVKHLLQDERSRFALEMAERHADGRASDEELAQAERAAVDVANADEGDCQPDVARAAAAYVAAKNVLTAVDPALWHAADTTLCYSTNQPVNCRDESRFNSQLLLRWRLLHDVMGNPFRPAALDSAWRTPSVVSLAQAIYDERAFDRMPILADALEDAGCTDPSILEHCRGGGVHARGCWVVDLLLGKE